MKKSLLIDNDTDALSSLELPRGRLMVNGFVAHFSPEQVIDAVNAIILYTDSDHCDNPPEPFVSQAGIIAFSIKIGSIGRELEASAF